MTRCPQCGTENPSAAQFCMRCGAALGRRCPACGAENPREAQFCLRCGTPLATAPSAERRIVTVLFADLVGSTPLALRLDPEPMRGIQADYFAAMREEVERHGGVVEKFIGDAVMAAFGLQAAHEDDPDRAIRSALAMRERMRDLNIRLGADLHLRIGISTGEVVADPSAVRAGEFMVTGEAVNLAARLQQQASADGIVIDERTCRAAWGVVQCEPLPTPREGELAGRPRWVVLGVADRRPTPRLRAPLLGREGEMQFLQAVYRRAVEARRPHLVTILGPAGVGKSRLGEEFLTALRGESAGVQILQGRCPAYGEGLTYWPVGEMLRQAFGVQDGDAPEAVMARLREGVERACAGTVGEDDREAIVAGLAPLLGVEISPRDDLPPDRLQAVRRTVEGRAAVLENPGALAAPSRSDDALPRSLRAFLAARAVTAPLVLAIEDLHWAEQSLLDLLEHLVVRITDAPILILCLARPDLLERHPHWGGRVRNYTAVSLSPLSAPHSRRLITDLLGGEAVPVGVRDAILARAEGNPFFIEEILRMLIDRGGLTRDEGGWRWASHPAEISIPETIHGILASRLDLLSALEKRVVGDASLLGRAFWLGPLITVSGLHPAEVAAALDRLQEREVVEERPVSTVAGEREFAFRHALIREVAYASLPKAQRSAKHLRFAEWLEASPGPDDEWLPLRAHHYEQAWRAKFETGEGDEPLARRAIGALRRAGQRARTVRTLPEARRLFERALAVLRNAGLEADVPLLLELLTERCEVTKWMAPPDLEDIETVLRLAPTIGRHDLLARAWLNRAFAEYGRNRLAPAEEAVQKALDLFGAQRDRGGEAEALEVLGFITEDLRGRLTTAHAAYRKAFAMYREMGDGQGMSRTLARVGRALLDNGRLAESRQALTQARDLARVHHEPLSDASAVTGLAVLAHLEGDDGEAERRFREAIAIRHDMGNLLAEAYTRQRLAMHYLRVGRLDDAERELRTARALRREHGVTTESALILRGLAELSLARGDLLAAAELAEGAVAALPETDAIARATHGATLGRIRAAQGRREEAEALFRESMQILEQKEYPIDLALALLRYGEALTRLGERARAGTALARAQALFAGMGAGRFVREVDRLLRAAGAGEGHDGC